MKVVEIHAEDWKLEHNQMKLEGAATLGTAHCIVVGLLLTEDQNKVVVAQEFFEDEKCVRGLVSIPRGCIMSMVEMKRDAHPGRRADSLYDQCVDLLEYIKQDPKQTLIPDGRVKQLKDTLYPITDDR